MQAIAQLIPLTAPGWWALAAVLLFVIELLLPGVFMLWLGLGAAIVAFALLFVAIELPMQVLAFAVLSLASAAIGSRWYRGHKHAPQGELREPEMYLVGHAGTVAEPLLHGHGKVKVGDTVWLAEGPDLGVGADIRVVAQKGTVLVVERAA